MGREDNFGQEKQTERWASMKNQITVFFDHHVRMGGRKSQGTQRTRLFLYSVCSNSHCLFNLSISREEHGDTIYKRHRPITSPLMQMYLNLHMSICHEHSHAHLYEDAYAYTHVQRVFLRYTTHQYKRKLKEMMLLWKHTTQRWSDCIG